jgi:hypothetical protein
MTAMKARIAMTMNKGGKIISYQWRQAGWISDIAHTKTITRKKTVCLPFQRNISCPYPREPRTRISRRGKKKGSTVGAVPLNG